MTYSVTIRRNRDGAERIYVMDEEWSEDCVFLWEEGSYCHDGNRAKFFAWAAGEEPEDTPYGHTEYTVRAINLPDGTEVYDEIPPERAA